MNPFRDSKVKEEPKFKLLTSFMDVFKKDKNSQNQNFEAMNTPSGINGKRSKSFKMPLKRRKTLIEKKQILDKEVQKALSISKKIQKLLKELYRLTKTMWFFK